MAVVASLFSELRAKVEAREKRVAAGSRERVPWDQNLHTRKQRFQQAYRYVLWERVKALRADDGSSGSSSSNLVCEGTAVPDDGTLDPADCLTFKQTDDHIGTTVYTAAVQSARFIEHDGALAGKRVLELGSGTGFVGVIAAAACGAEVVLTDLEGPVLDNCRANVAALPDAIRARVTVMPLPWGEDILTLGLPSQEPFDVILGIEVIYQRQFVAPLVATLAQLAAHSPNALVVWAHDERGRPGVPLFKQLTAKLISFTPVDEARFASGYICDNVRVYEGRYTEGAKAGTETQWRELAAAAAAGADGEARNNEGTESA